MTTLHITHPCFLEHDTGPGHPERPDRMRAIDKALSHEVFKTLERAEAPLREDVEQWIGSYRRNGQVRLHEVRRHR